MKIKISSGKLCCVFFIGFIGIFSETNAQNTVYFYRDSVLAITPGYIPAIVKMDSLKTAYNKEIQTANQQLEGKINSLINPYKPTKEETVEIIKKRMTASDTTQLSLLIKEGQFIGEKTKTYNLLYKQAFEKEVQSILTKVDAIITKYATTNKIDFVYMMEELEKSLAYMNKKKNITPAIKAEVLKMGIQK
jgi:Skp family chaperone for outer membrane proteins